MVRAIAWLRHAERMTRIGGARSDGMVPEWPSIGPMERPCYWQ
jgi:hypothetical protein